MRNRPDSRHRLARLSPAPVAPDRPTASAGEPGGWVPGDDEDLFGAGDVDDQDPDPDLDPDPDPDLDPGAGGAGPPESSPAGHRARRVRRTRHDPWGRLAQRWVPEPLRDSRIDPGKRGALLLTVVAAVAALVAAIGVWRDRPEPRPVQSVSLAQVTDTGRATGSLPPLVRLGGAATGRAVSSSSPTTPAPSVIVVSVTGAVRRPGLVRLAVGARIADAIDKAGGAAPGADLTGLNLAAKLSDGASVVVSDGSRPAAGSGSSTTGSGGGSGADSPGAATGSGRPAGKLDLNTADVAALDALPGVGPVTAANIVAWREKNGRYASVEQLQEIAGIGPAKYAALAPLVTVQ